MAGTLAELAAAIGGRVRQQRTARGWTLDQLAEAAGVSRRMIVHVEQGTANPSVETLLRLSDGLGVSLPALVEPPTLRPFTVVRGDQGAILWSSPAGGRAALMGSVDSPDVVELWDWTLAAGDRHRSAPHRPLTRELLQVRSGTLVVEVAGESVTLQSGDALTFAADAPHGYLNPGTEPTRFSLAVYEPGVATPGSPTPHAPIPTPAPTPTPQPNSRSHLAHTAPTANPEA